MALSRVTLIGNGSTKAFTVPFTFISRQHVRVRLNGITMATPGWWIWVSDSMIQFHNAPPEGAVIIIERRTPITERLVAFQNGAVLTEEELNLAVSQLLYRQQELADFIEGTLEDGLHRITGGQAVPAQEAIDAIVQEILASQALADLNQKVNDITLNAETLLEHDTRITGMQAIVDELGDIEGEGIVTFLQNEQQARIEGDAALAEDISFIGAARVDGEGAKIAFDLNVSTVFVDSTTTIGQRFTALQAGVNDNEALIFAEAQVRADEDSALASSISLLSAEVDGKATIAQWNEVRADADSLLAKAGLALDVNGHVIGWSLHNDGDSGEFIIQADKFAIVDPSNSSNVKVPFVVSGGTVFMQDVVIGSALIADLSVTKLTAGTLDAVINVGEGRIVWDNGTYIKATGIGFGTSNQFLEWFGPRPTGGNLALCNEASAIQYLKTNGDAYFGGALHAGTLTSSATSTSLAAPTIDVEIGPFTSNGNTILVNYSYTAQASWQSASPVTTNPTAQIRLYRRLGGGSETLVATRNLTGSHNANFIDGPNVYQNNQSISTSFSYTDPDTVTTNRTYRLELSARSMGASPFNQRLSVISTEE